MRLQVENEAGKSEATFVPAAAVRRAQLELGPAPEAGTDGFEGHGFATAIYCAWYAWEAKGWTDAESWEDFAEDHSVVLIPDADPSPSSA